MNRARIKNNIKLHFKISQPLLNYFMRFKDQNAQEQKIYTKHGMDLRNREIDFLLVFEESWDSVAIWLVWARTDEDLASTRWMVKLLWLHEAWNSSNPTLPWMMLWRKQSGRRLSSCGMMVEMGSQCCLDGESTKLARGLLSFLTDFEKMARNEVLREWVIFSVFVAARVCFREANSLRNYFDKWGRRNGLTWFLLKQCPEMHLRNLNGDAFL